jgi:hypothetical protein
MRVRTIPDLYRNERATVLRQFRLKFRVRFTSHGIKNISGSANRTKKRPRAEERHTGAARLRGLTPGWLEANDREL